MKTTSDSIANSTSPSDSSLSGGDQETIAPGNHGDGGYDQDDECKTNNPKSLSSFSHQWSTLVKRFAHRPVLAVLRPMARVSARYPKRTILAIIVISVALLITGFQTNFVFNVDTDEMWTPIRSYPLAHMHYIAETFEASPRYFVLVFHAHGDNVINAKSIRRGFDALDAVLGHPEYEPICSEYGEALVSRPDGTIFNSCDIYGVTRFWWNNRTEFDLSAEVAAQDSDPIAVAEEHFIHTRLAKRAFPDQFPVLHNEILGFLDYNVTYAKSAKSFTIVISLPEHHRTRVAELEMVDAVLALNTGWQREDATTTGLRVEVNAEESIPEESVRAVNEDIALGPVIFFGMSIFTSFCFARRDAVYSRAALGAAAVVSVMFSIISGFGLMFILGTPFTPITQLLPFLIFGIGLDDAFIMMGSYTSMDPAKDVVQRIDVMVNDIGLSITMTTLTSALAFALGCTSSIPVVFWLCLYCFATIVIVFIYQMTFFVACIALDERRISHGRRDVVCCFKSKDVVLGAKGPGEQIADRIMGWYADQLLRPWVRVLVVVCFAGLFGVSAYSATLMRQRFKLTDCLPRGSYVTDFLDAINDYQNRTQIEVQVVFRDIDQSDENVRREMKEYIKSLTDLDFAADARTETYWTSLFDFYLTFNTGEIGKTFNQQLDEFLSIPINKAAVGPDIVRDDDGNVIASRVRIKFTVDLHDVKDQTNVLKQQLNATLMSPLNDGREDRLAAFSFAKPYAEYEFNVRSLSELKSTIIVGVFSVTAVAVLLIPHWTASIFVCPLIIMLFVDLLGAMQWGGLSINFLTYIALTMSIGLLVDFIMHTLFAYYALPGNRVDKTKEMLRTMGSSILLGGVTTFLGTLPLYFASSEACRIIFVSFVGIVTIGVGHGLILVPVVLATIGPEDQVSMSVYTKSGDDASANDDLTLADDKNEALTNDEYLVSRNSSSNLSLLYDNTTDQIEANEETTC